MDTARQHDTTGSTVLRLWPFRGVRFDPARVGDVGVVTSPPYDVMDRPMVERALDASPHNIVRLTLPRLVSDPMEAADPYARAAKRLGRWREGAVLVTDPAPAVYVYEYGGPDCMVVGVIGALDLPAPGSPIVLPHEDVIPEVVADRLAMMTAAQSNLEPILLVYDGEGGSRAVLDRVRAGDPLTDITTPDGIHHRLWALTDPGLISTLDTVHARHQALIADGHHRFATYRQLQDHHHRRGDGPGPWDRGLVLLIDQSDFPLQLGAIHRSVCELVLETLDVPAGLGISAPAQVGGTVRGQPAAATVDTVPRAGEIVLSDGRRSRWVRRDADRDPTVSDAALLHDSLLPRWGVTDDRVSYHHTVEQTLRTAEQDGGVAILLHPTTVAEVMEVARAGKVMPRKSTSFGPKPRTGLVMRCFDEAGDRV